MTTGFVPPSPSKCHQLGSSGRAWEEPIGWAGPQPTDDPAVMQGMTSERQRRRKLLTGAAGVWRLPLSTPRPSRRPIRDRPGRGGEIKTHPTRQSAAETISRERSRQPCEVALVPIAEPLRQEALSNARLRPSVSSPSVRSSGRPRQCAACRHPDAPPPHHTTSGSRNVGGDASSFNDPDLRTESRPANPATSRLPTRFESESPDES